MIRIQNLLYAYKGQLHHACTYDKKKNQLKLRKKNLLKLKQRKTFGERLWECRTEYDILRVTMVCLGVELQSPAPSSTDKRNVRTVPKVK